MEYEGHETILVVSMDGKERILKGCPESFPPKNLKDSGCKHKKYGKFQASFTLTDEKYKEKVNVTVFNTKTGEMVFKGELPLEDGVFTIPNYVEFEKDVEYQMWATVIYDVGVD